MAVEDTPEGVKFTGPPLVEQVQQMLSPYAGGTPVRGVLLTAKGLDVWFEDGSRYLFVPVPDGHSLIAKPNGELDVVPGAFGS